MKTTNIISILILLFALNFTACSGKRTSESSVNILGASVSSIINNFEGGMIIYVSKDGELFRVKHLSPLNSSIVLPKGRYRFYGVGWKGNENSVAYELTERLTGEMKCSLSPEINLLSEEVDVELSFTNTKCEQDIFTGRTHANQKMKIENCSSYADLASSCSGNIGTAKSYKFVMETDNGGVESACYGNFGGRLYSKSLYLGAGGANALRIPYSLYGELKFPVSIYSWDNDFCGGLAHTADVNTASSSILYELGISEDYDDSVFLDVGQSTSVLLRTNFLSTY
ncbi:hypothetical protein N9O57_00295 [bacterium]|nr:hypothetical protein [bacterium]